MKIIELLDKMDGWGGRWTKGSGIERSTLDYQRMTRMDADEEGRMRFFGGAEEIGRDGRDGQDDWRCGWSNDRQGVVVSKRVATLDA